eukprot:jgi/Ulvmu1/430/UM001_0437.1
MVSSKHEHETKARVRQEQHSKVIDKKAENLGEMRMDRHPGNGSSLKPATKKGGSGLGNWGSLGSEIRDGMAVNNYMPTEPEAKLQVE